MIVEYLFKGNDREAGQGRSKWECAWSTIRAEFESVDSKRGVFTQIKKFGWTRGQPLAELFNDFVDRTLLSCLVPIRIWCLAWKSSRSFLKSLHKSHHNVWCTSFQEPSIESQHHVTSPFSCLHVRVASHFVYLSWRTDFSIVCFSKWSMSRTAWAPAR